MLINQLYGNRDVGDMSRGDREKDRGAGRMLVTRTSPSASGAALSSPAMKQRARQQGCQACRSSSMKLGALPSALACRGHMKEGLGGRGAADTYNQGPA